MISLLRKLDISVSKIKDLLQADTTSLRSLLNDKLQPLTRELALKQLALRSIERLAIAGQLSPYDINLRHEPDQTVAQLSDISDAEHMIEDGARLIYQLYDELCQYDRTFEDPVMCINEDPDYQECITVHACIGIHQPVPKLKSASIVTIAGGTMAWLTPHGAYEELGLAYHALMAWIQQHGHKQSAAMREIYLNDPTSTPVDQLQTEVLLLIKEK
ncbi:MAG: effector-binding domain-containing protein [Gammaproteobacteria bacterium]|jgi:effector-binding domain-containing protein